MLLVDLALASGGRGEILHVADGGLGERHNVDGSGEDATPQWASCRSCHGGIIGDGWRSYLFFSYLCQASEDQKQGCSKLAVSKFVVNGPVPLRLP